MSNQREQFRSRLGFILAAAGSAVGIGNLVGFPVNAAKSGGAAFLLIYAAFVVVICLPVMMAEMALGRKTQRNPLGAYQAVAGKGSLWRFGGWLALITPFMIAVFYQVLTVWLLGYFIGAVSGNLEAMAAPGYFGEFINANGVFIYLVILTMVVGIILNSGVQNGIERLAKILMPSLFVMLIVLTIFVLTLPNALVGVKYYLVPDFSKINLEVVNLALSQAFFSLSLGMGILITYGSYVSSKESVAGGAKMVAAVDTSVAFFAGLLILPAIFVFNPDTDTAELSSSSVSLVFSFLPKIFLSLQALVGYVGASLFASAFFLLVFFAALTSQVSILQVPISAFQDELKFSRFKSVLALGLCAGLLVIASTVSFGMSSFFTEFVSYAGQTKSFFDVIIDIFYETILPLNGFIICLFVVYKWRRSDFNDEMSIGDEAFDKSLTKKYVNLALGTFVPAILLFVFVSTVLLKFFGVSVI
ncbi:sodium-dependent transporter [Arenicella xantha]|uniref:NSS family neurotransmitter:Na+ symporter n=1 Tax=Arenicella xantha TaxID=644221 RepID=A0A395JF97_9GAMM|nr:sodium-dependent transporter [Arenicella xantha]RBP48313.1 NSS family neurotransmitter:Na+ symporter [Arenicella xantha]